MLFISAHSFVSPCRSPERTDRLLCFPVPEQPDEEQSVSKRHAEQAPDQGVLPGKNGEQEKDQPGCTQADTGNIDEGVQCLLIHGVVLHFIVIHAAGVLFPGFPSSRGSGPGRTSAGWRKAG